MAATSARLPPAQMKLFKGRSNRYGQRPVMWGVLLPGRPDHYFDTDFFQVLKTQFGSSGGPLAPGSTWWPTSTAITSKNLLGDLERAQKSCLKPQGGEVRSGTAGRRCYAGVMGTLRIDHQGATCTTVGSAG